MSAGELAERMARAVSTSSGAAVVALVGALGVALLLDRLDRRDRERVKAQLAVVEGGR